jgi:hypothetical protein
MSAYALLQQFVIPEFWFYNFYVPIDKLHDLVNGDELQMWDSHNDVEETVARLRRAPNVIMTQSVDTPTTGMLPDGVAVVKWHINVVATN